MDEEEDYPYNAHTDLQLHKQVSRGVEFDNLNRTMAANALNYSTVQSNARDRANQSVHYFKYSIISTESQIGPRRKPRGKVSKPLEITNDMRSKEDKDMNEKLVFQYIQCRQYKKLKEHLNYIRQPSY